jgi:hypothetical protein
LLAIAIGVAPQPATAQDDQFTPTPLPTLSSPANVTGTWNVILEGEVGGTCEAVIDQAGSELSSIAACTILGTIPLNGTIDPATGAFEVSFKPAISVEGRVEADGGSFSGTWSAFGTLAGSVTGERADDIKLRDVGREWDLVVLSEARDTCSLSIDADFLRATATLDCVASGSRTLEGTIGPFERFITLSDATGGLSAQQDPGGGYAFGTLFTEASRVSETIIAVQRDGLERGIVLIGCRFDGRVSRTCTQGFDPREATDNDIEIDVMLPVAPKGGYSGFEISLSAPKALNFLSASHSCTTGKATVEDRAATFTCTSDDRMSDEGDLMSFTMTCKANRQSIPVEIEHIAFMDADERLGTPTLIGAEVNCLGPSLPHSLFGDVDCSITVNSIDALLVLQFDAGLIADVPCDRQADANFNNRITSDDAIAIVRWVAGA